MFLAPYFGFYSHMVSIAIRRRSGLGDRCQCPPWALRDRRDCSRSDDPHELLPITEGNKLRRSKIIQFGDLTQYGAKSLAKCSQAVFDVRWDLREYLPVNNLEAHKLLQTLI